MGLSPKNARRQAGYTLIELMIIVTIIGISVTAFAPGVGRAMSDRRVSTAARELIRLGRRARSDTFGYLRAHTLWIQPSTGQVQLLRSRTNSCLLMPWSDCATTPQTCVESVSLRGDSGQIAMSEETLAGGGARAYGSSNRAVCYAPNGIVYFSSVATLDTAAANFSDLNTVNGGIVYALYAAGADPNATTTRMHRVLFPLGTTPRALR